MFRKNYNLHITLILHECKFHSYVRSNVAKSHIIIVKPWKVFGVILEILWRTSSSTFHNLPNGQTDLPTVSENQWLSPISIPIPHSSLRIPNYWYGGMQPHPYWRMQRAISISARTSCIQCIYIHIFLVVLDWIPVVKLSFFFQTYCILSLISSNSLI